MQCKRSRSVVLALVLAMAPALTLDSRVFAQTTGTASRTNDNTYSGYNNYISGSMRWAERTTAGLPAAASNTGKVFIVTDSTSASLCNSGGGSTVAICRSNGSSYVSLGGSAASATVPMVTTRTSGSVLTIGSDCVVGSTNPCITRLGASVYTFTAGATATLTTGSGLAYIYISSGGAITVGVPAGITSIACSGCTIANGITDFPVDSVPLYTWNATANVWDATGTNVRALISAGRRFTAGANVTLTQMGSEVVIAASAGGGAPTDATYITQTANGTLSAEQALGALSTGCLGSTTTTGVVAARTITGTATKITVTNGDCSGNPTITIPDSVTLVTPTVSSTGFTNANHAHAAANSGGTLDAAAIASGTVATARLGSGTANNTTFLRGDQTWAAPGGSSAVTCGRVTLSTAQVLALDATPITLVAAQGANTVITPLHLRYRLVYNSATYAGGANLLLKYTDNAGEIIITSPTVSATYVNSPASAYHSTTATGHTTLAVAGASNQAVVLTSAVAFTTGNSPLDVDICYTVQTY